MSEQEKTTKENIIKEGKKEFLEKGFKSASLRNIAKNAGVTTGAFYGYYKSKEQLFDAIVEEPAKIFMNKFNDAQNLFEQLSPKEQEEQMGKLSGHYMDWMVGYVYENMDAFKLILCHSEGTKYENFVHNMVEIEVESTLRFMEVLKKLGNNVKEIEPELIHILASSLFSGFFEIVIHDMPYENALEYVKILREFHTEGWKSILNI